MAALSTRDLGRRVGVSAQAISKYERGLDKPSSGVLIRLAKALGVHIEFFFRPTRIQDFTLAYRKRAALPKKATDAILARVREWLERYLETETLATKHSQVFSWPRGFPYRVDSVAQVEQAAMILRGRWHMGLAPVENLVELLEDRGVKVGLIEADTHFDACAFWVKVNNGIPVIVIRAGQPGDRQRLDLAHELGHLFLHPSRGVDHEKVAFRFGAAFLVPEPVVREELGDRRRLLNTYELHLLKHKYGLSMQAWIYRAKDLAILSDLEAGRLFREFRIRHWNTLEPGDQYPPEQPERFARLIMKILAENIVSESRAAELLGKSIAEFSREVQQKHGAIPVTMRS